MDSINDSLDRGVEFRILADVHAKTIRFFEQLDSRIEIRHLENQSQMGFYVDGDVGYRLYNQKVILPDVAKKILPLNRYRIT